MASNTGLLDVSQQKVPVCTHLKINSSSLEEATGEFLHFFDDPSVYIDITSDHSVLIGKQQKLYRIRRDNQSSKTNLWENAQVQVINNSSGLYLEEEEIITGIKWMPEHHVCVGYSTGTIRIFHLDGRMIYEQRFHSASVVKVDVNDQASTSVSSNRVHVELQDIKSTSGELWVLYRDSTLVIIQLTDLFATSTLTSGQRGKFHKYSLRDQTDLVDVKSCGPCRPTIFQSHARMGIYTIVGASASTPFLAFYHAGNDQNSIIHLAHIATAMATRAAGAVWSFAKSWGWRSGEETLNEENMIQIPPSTSDSSVADHVPAPLGSIRWYPEDERRRSRMLVVSPTGRLAAVTDTLGRVLLVDTWRMVVIRMWKGYRNAQCGWMHGYEGKGRPLGLYLVIYSAQRGMVEVWRSRFGPRVCMLPVGLHAKLFTIFDRTKKLVKCMVLSEIKEGKTTLVELQMNAPNAATLVKYFTQNKLQEENFLLHQVISAVRSYAKKEKKSQKKRSSSSLTTSPIFFGGSSDSNSIFQKNSSSNHGHHLVTTREEEEEQQVISQKLHGLTSSTSFITLLELLHQHQMKHLSVNFRLKVMDQMIEVLKKRFETRTASSTELALVWELLWKRRLLQGYKGLCDEFDSAKKFLGPEGHGKMSFWALTIDESSATFSRTGLEYISPPRLRPWVELFRRAGLKLNDRSSEETKAAIAQASTLTPLEFLHFFSQPFDNPDIGNDREVIKAFVAGGDQVYDYREPANEKFFINAFKILKTSVLRPFPSPSSGQTVMTHAFLLFCFTPILSSVFAVQELQHLHCLLLLQTNDHMELFIQWYFSLPVGLILSLPAPSSSSSLGRWVQPFIDSMNHEKDMKEDRRDDILLKGAQQQYTATSRKRRLASVSPSLSKLFDACWMTNHLLHAFILAEHCMWGELARARHLEEATLGEFSAISCGIRWKTLQDAIAKTVHLALRLGRLGKLSIQAVEQVDEIIRTVALFQLNDEEEVDHATVASIVSQPVEESSTSNPDPWIATFESCHTAQQMKDWSSVLSWFSQWNDPDALCCIRALVLCTAWNAERSEMHQLEDALDEILTHLKSTRLRASMSVFVWEQFVRVHIVTLMSFWEESANGRLPPRGLQPAIARRFFAIVKKLLVGLETTIDSLFKSKRDLTISLDQPSALILDGQEDDDDEDEEDQTNGIEELGQAEFRMSFLTKRNRWPCPVQTLDHIFHLNWPPSYNDGSHLMKSLKQFQWHQVSLEQVRDHLSLVLVLDAFAATSLSPISITRLFLWGGAHLCRSDSFMISTRQTIEDREGPSTIIDDKNYTKIDLVIQQERISFLQQLLRVDDALGFQLAESFRLSVDMIREEHVLYLFRSAQDESGDISFQKLKEPQRLSLPLMCIARARLSIILKRMKAEPEYAMIMASLPADLFTWITSGKPPFTIDTQVESLDHTPSLSTTSRLLQKCLPFLQPNTPEFVKASEMFILVKTVITQVTKIMSKRKKNTG